MKFFIRTYGCQMNARDSDAATALLVSRGHCPVASEDDAEIVILNTCSVREQAERKAIGKLGILQRLKRRRPEIFIGLMGCMAESRGEEVLNTLPHVDFAIGPGQFHTLPDVIDSELKRRSQEIRIGIEGDDEYLASMGRHYRDGESKISAFIAVMRGCNRFCSYCIVPYVRGRERSRPMSDIVEEAKALVADGVREIMLLGQNIAAYGLDGKAPPAFDDTASPFAELLSSLNGINALARIRFTSPHPAYFNERLIEAIAMLPKVCHGIHLPLQSGSNGILKLMNRPYTAEHYLKVVKTLRSKVPDIAFSTDVIVGFPGETDDDFEATRRLMDEVSFDNAFIFKYSPRKGTAAAKLEDQVPQSLKEERNKILLDDLAARTLRHNQSFVGSTVEVMAEGPSKRNAARWAGRTGTNKIVLFEPLPGIREGDLLEVKIKRATSMSLFGDGAVLSQAQS
ncbi:MAG: tRNA (N6-isopentenyl adenosine(37)-C2)-methylthiotransferase MiaB [Lentisphaerae bacterium GWF2_52_8]|nr:MAG: tRNA (N6-isopentenyl adenosine(37)-C2)-methylthiotransferase MiaB [Lentisphaerae bacterium GWF2_52_8]